MKKFYFVATATKRLKDLLHTNDGKCIGCQKKLIIFYLDKEDWPACGKCINGLNEEIDSREGET